MFASMLVFFKPQSKNVHCTGRCATHESLPLCVPAEKSSEEMHYFE
jgi:hypothetical protein